MQFGTLTFVGTPTTNDTVNYTLEFSIDNVDNIDIIKQVKIAGVQNIANPQISTRDDNNNQIPTSDVLIYSPSLADEASTYDIEFKFEPDNPDSISNLHVTMEGQLSTEDLADDIQQNATVKLSGKNDTQITQSTTLEISDQADSTASSDSTGDSEPPEM